LVIENLAPFPPAPWLRLCLLGRDRSRLGWTADACPALVRTAWRSSLL